VVVQEEKIDLVVEVLEDLEKEELTLQLIQILIQ
jgi:hypothetical protein